MGGDVQVKPYFGVDVNVNSIDGSSYSIDVLAYFIQWNKMYKDEIDCHYTCCLAYIHNASEKNQNKAKLLMSGIIRKCFAKFVVPESADFDWSNADKILKLRPTRCTK